MASQINGYSSSYPCMSYLHPMPIELGMYVRLANSKRLLGHTRVLIRTGLQDRNKEPISSYANQSTEIRGVRLACKRPFIKTSSDKTSIHLNLLFSTAPTIKPLSRFQRKRKDAFLQKRPRRRPPNCNDIGNGSETADPLTSSQVHKREICTQKPSVNFL